MRKVKLSGNLDGKALVTIEHTFGGRRCILQLWRPPRYLRWRFVAPLAALSGGRNVSLALGNPGPIRI